MHKGSDKGQVKGGIQMAKRGENIHKRKAGRWEGRLYQRAHRRRKANLGLSVWIRLRNSQRQSNETKSPVRSFTQLLGWSLLSRTGENRQLFRSARMISGSRFLTTPAPLLTASDFHQTKRPAYHTQIAQYTGHSGYSLRHWYS